MRYGDINPSEAPRSFLPSRSLAVTKLGNAKFDESIELHLVTEEVGRLSKEIMTEKKSALAHIKIGKVSLSQKELLEKCQGLIRTIGLYKIKRAVLTSTMGPGIKLDLSQLLTTGL